MARFLCTVWPLAGHLHPMLAVAHALRARGHVVGVYSGEAARTTVEAEGFVFFPFDHLSAWLREIVDGVALGGAGDDDDAFYWRLVARYSRGYGRNGPTRGRLLKAMSFEWYLGTVPAQVADLDVVIDRWQPDVVLCDPMLWAPFLVLHETRSLPVAVFSFFAGSMLPGTDAPPPGLGLPRPHTWRARVMVKLASAGVELFLARPMRQAANVVRRRYGLPALRESVVAWSGRMPLYLVATTPEYDCDRHDLPPSVHYIGACLWDRPHQNAAPDWLAHLPDDRPVVYVTEGTLHMQDPVLMRAALRGLAGQPMSVVMTTGRHRDPRMLGLERDASNIRIERFVPHSDLFPRLSAVVTHGGSGTVRAALDAGLPLVVVPRGWDQFDNAQRVAEVGAGVRLSARRCTPAALRAAVNRVLSDPSFRANARRIGMASARLGGPDRAASLLETLAQRSGVTPVNAFAGGELAR